MDNHAADRLRLCVYLCPESSLSSYALALDTFRMMQFVAGAPQVELCRVSQDGRAVAHPDGQMAVDGGLAALDGCAAVIVPALWLPTPACVTNNQAFVEALAGLRPTTLLVGLCSGAWLVAASGRLDGREATTHWALAERLQQCYPRVRVQADSNLTHDGNLICSGGATAALDACLHLAQLLGGPALARQLARLLVTHTRHGPQTRYAPSYGLRPHADGAIEQVERLIRERHADTLSLEALAAAIHVSARTLQRRFLVATGMTPMQYQQRVRVEAAKARLAQSDQTIERVARAVGYEDRVAFARLFRKVTGQTPGAYRQLARELPADAGARQK